MFKGYKTYITAALSILGALGAWAIGELELAEFIQITVTAILGATLRNGIG